jgi:dihydropyrimidinase
MPLFLFSLFRSCSANGVNGLQDRLSVVWNNGVVPGLLTPCRFVQVVSTNVAKLFGCYPRKGVIRPGSDADIVVWDPNAIRTVSAKTHMHRVDFNIFEGMKLQGVAEVTISRGRVVWENNNIVLDEHLGKGQYIPRQPFAHAFDSVQYRENARDAEEKPVEREPYTGPICQIIKEPTT